MFNTTWQKTLKISDDIIEQILINRKIDKSEWTNFLEPDFNKLHDPFLMKGLKEAVARIVKAYKNHEKIGIFADYDADGIPGAALLSDYLVRLGFEVSVFIPAREQGYGLSKEGIDFLKKENVNIIIAIDLGIRNIEEIKYAKKIGIETIILDHHEPGKALPSCVVVDPKQKNDKYPFKELSATGVVFKFICGLNKKLKKVNDGYLKWAMDLVAISTICDVVPLISENRIFAKFGLIVLKKTRRIGLQQLYRAAAISAENIGTYAVGFQIGPRLNAPGRMEHANISYYLLTENNPKKAAELAQKLNLVNLTRQEELKRVLNEARKKVQKNHLDQKRVILVEGKNWPQGIVGLVAGKLMEEYCRPVIVCENNNGNLRGSARSIDSYNMVAALEFAKDYLTKYGGHKKAAGLSLEIKHLSNLYDKLLELAESKIKDEDLVPKITIDVELKKEDLNLALLDKIKKLEPFGLGNPRPVFLLKNAKFTQIKTVGKDNRHLKMLVDGVSAIAFDFGKFNQELIKKPTGDLVFTLDEDNWSIRKLQLKIIDIKLKED